MKLKLKRILSCLLAAAALVCLMAAPASADVLDLSKKADLNLLMQYEDDEGNMVPVEGVVGLYRIALTRYLDGNQIYIPTATFVGSGIDVKNIMTEEDLLHQVPVSKLEKHISSYHLQPKYEAEIDENGIASFTDLAAGLYLVRAVKPDGKLMLYTMNSFLITLPREFPNGDYDYDCVVPVKPKVEVTRATVDIQVVKKWVKDKESDRPESITVELMNGSQVADTAELNKDNNWSWVFTDKPVGVEWKVQEKKVKGYTGKVGDMVYDQGVYTVVITNTWDPEGKLEQTGQLNWPVPILVVGGMLLMIGGYALSHEKKKFED